MNSEEKKYYEVSLAQVLKFRPYRKLLFCIYLLFSHENTTQEEIQQNLNNYETFQDFKRLWCTSIKHRMENESSFIAYENWKRCVSNNPRVIEFLYNHRRNATPQGVLSLERSHLDHFTSDYQGVNMSSNKSTDPRMTKVKDPKSIYYQYSSLKKLLSEEDIQLMQPLEDSLKQQGQLKPPFGKCYFCKDPTHWIGDCPEANKPRSQQATEQKKPPFGQC